MENDPFLLRDSPSPIHSESYMPDLLHPHTQAELGHDFWILSPLGWLPYYSWRDPGGGMVPTAEDITPKVEQVACCREGYHFLHLRSRPLAMAQFYNYISFVCCSYITFGFS